jgi:mycobactin phenyloxazoline synthetase
VLTLLFGEILGVSEVGRDDDFFELGGHSIAATRLFARLVELLQSDLSLRELFAQRSVARLAERMSTGADGARVARIAEVVLEVLAGDEDAEEAA